MKKLLGLLIVLVLAVTVSIGIAAQSAEDTPVEESLGTYYEEAMEQAEAPDDPVLAVYKDQTVLRSVVDSKSRPKPPWPGWTLPPSRTGRWWITC